METSNEGRNEKTFKHFGKKLDGFVGELNEATERLKKEFQGKYEELKVSAEKLKTESDNKDRWKEVEDSLKKAGDELANAFRAAFKKTDPQDPTK